MNKVSLLTLGKKLRDGNLYVISIHDLEPNGLIVHAYDQSNSKEYILPITEFQVCAELAFSFLALGPDDDPLYVHANIQLVAARYSRSKESLTALIESVDIFPQGKDFVLVSSNDALPAPKQRLQGADLEQLLKEQLAYGGPTMNELMVTGLLELCKVKPVGLDAVRWLGEWFLANNPVKPNVVDPDEE
eukprot:gene27235-35175_t